ncbi:YncE family protein [Nannocystis pusilla]|uniref:YncE family protein n=1 Tax=Nannocystis pusilla TaxID=889268 RepID=UPI003BF0344D
MHIHRTLILSVALAAACGDDSVVVTDSDGQTSSTGATTTGTTTGDDTPTEPGTTTSTTRVTGTTSTVTTDPTTGQVSATTDDTTTTTTTGETTSTTSETTTTTTTESTTTTDTSTTTDTTTTTTGDTTTPSTTTDTTTTGTSTDTGETSTTGDTGEPVEEGLGYAGMSGNNSLVIFDPQTKQVVGAPVSLLPHASYPYDAVIKPDGSEVWVVGAVGDGVKVLDTATGLIAQEISLTGVGEYAVDVLFNGDGSRAYVSARDSAALVQIDTASYSVLEAFAVPAGMEGGKTALDPCTGAVHLVDWYESNLIRFDPVTEAMTSKPLGDSLWDLRVDPSGSTLYVTDRGLDVVHVLDAATLEVQATVSVGDDPWGIDITSDGALVVVVCEDDRTVHFIDTAALTTTSLVLPAGAKPRDVDISADDARAYVPSGDLPGNDGVFEIDLATKSLTGLIDFGISANTNVVAVKPQPVACEP